MADEIRLLGAFGGAFSLSLVLTPLARALAVRTDFVDRPTGYKQHDRPTPYLGGASLLCAWAVAAFVFGGGAPDLAVTAASAIVLFAVGTTDDRIGLGVAPRLGVQIAVALALWIAGAGWDLFSAEGANLALTVFWVVALVNGFNLMDNLDGAAATTAAASAMGVAILATTEEMVALAAVIVALAGACTGFLPYNLARPSRIFLGDGGSMPIGFLLAASVMALPPAHPGWVGLLASIPLVGVVLFDTTLVVVSRRRRGAPVLHGARDHTTHRVLVWARSPRRVAAVLALTQGVLCAAAIELAELGGAAVRMAAVAYFVLGALAIIAFERSPQTLELGPRSHRTV